MITCTLNRENFDQMSLKHTLKAQQVDHQLLFIPHICLKSLLATTFITLHQLVPLHPIVIVSNELNLLIKLSNSYPIIFQCIR